ncbi:ABC transporter ATP-binding protein [Synechococcus elongatus IITB4]|uniref:ABC transporter ATP-binding protein n=1 Tax=Synechococcus elongatus TaxID=32046 RepID=UPI0030D467DE
MSQAEVLCLDRVCKQFTGSSIAAVDQVSFRLAPGEILGLVGPSGCGKTTLLRMIAGFESLQSGSIQLAGETVATAQRSLPPEARAVGMVFQDYALFPHLTVLDNVCFGLRDRKGAASIARQSLALVGLEGLERRYPHELSGGQQQRVALARALAPQPPLILLDEPLSNLDVQVRLRLRQELRDILRQAQATAILVTHDQEEALSICDRVAVMRLGRFEQMGPPEELFQRPASRFVAEFLSQANFLATDYRDNIWHTVLGDFEALMAPEGGRTGGEPPVVMVRQEEVWLQPHPEGDGLIRDRQFLGRDYRYFVQLPAGLEIQALGPVSEAITVGTAVQVQLRSGQARLYPYDLPLVWRGTSTCPAPARA